MAGPYYVRSDGDDTTGTSWATAKTTVLGALALAAAGDIIYVDSAQSDSATGNQTYNPPASSLLSPVVLISVDSTGDPEPPTTGDYQAGATIASSDNDVSINYNVATGNLFLYGFIIKAFNQIRIAFGGVQRFFDCEFWSTRTSGLTYLLRPGTSGAEFYTCRFYTAQSSVSYLFQNPSGGGAGKFKLVGCTHVSGTGTFDTLAYRPYGDFVIENCDFSSLLSSGATIFDVSGAQPQLRAHIEGLKLPASWTMFSNGAGYGAPHVEAYHIGSADSLTSFHIETDSIGSAVPNTTTYLDSAFSVQIDQLGSSADFFVRIPITTINNPTANATVTVELVFDSNDASDLTDDEFWIEVSYPNSSVGAYRPIASSRASEFFLSPSNLTSSAASWNGTSGFTGSAVKRKVSLTLSGDQSGPLKVWANLRYSADMTVYVEPAVTLA